MLGSAVRTCAMWRSRPRASSPSLSSARSLALIDGAADRISAAIETLGVGASGRSKGDAGASGAGEEA